MFVQGTNLPADDNSGGGDDGAGVSMYTVTLGFVPPVDVNSEWAFGGATADQATHDGTGVLAFTHPVVLVLGGCHDCDWLW